jgi:hypothetical protein
MGHAPGLSPAASAGDADCVPSPGILLCPERRFRSHESDGSTSTGGPAEPRPGPGPGRGRRGPVR